MMDCYELSALDLDINGQTAVVDACCSNGSYAAFKHALGISVCFLSNLDVPLLHLSSDFLDERPTAALHIQAGRLGPNNRRIPHQQQETLLAAASASGVLVWVLEEAYAAAAAAQHPPTPLRLTDNTPTATSEALVISGDGLLAVSCDSTAIVWDLQQLEVVYRLEGHQGVITALTFSPHQRQQLISAAEDRTFKVWDLAAGQLLYQSSVLGASPPTCLAMDPHTPRLVMGCVDGSIKQFDLAMLPACRDMQVLDLSKSMQQIAAAAAAAAAALEHKQAAGPQTISATSAATGSVAVVRQQVQQLTSISTTGAAHAAASNDDADGGCKDLANIQLNGSGCILSMQFVQPGELSKMYGTHSSGAASGSLSLTDGSRSSSSQQLIDDLSRPPPQLLVCTRRGLLLVNLGSGEAEQCYVFGMDAARVWQGVTTAGLDNLQIRTAAPAAPHLPVSVLQQPAAQQQQQQSRWLSRFCALSGVEQPASACCFAVHQQQGQGQHQQQLICCIASNTSCSVIVLRLSPASMSNIALGAGLLLQGGGLQAGALSQQRRQQQLSVFQTQPLPANSPLLPKYSRRMSNTMVELQQQPPVEEADSNDTAHATGLEPPDSSGRRATWADTIAAAPGRIGDRTNFIAASRASKPAKISSRGSTSSGGKPPKGISSSKLQDKPVTFHRKVKSSGYGFVQPQTRLGQPKPAAIKVSQANSKVPQLLAQQLSAQRQYPMDSDPPVVPLLDQQLPSNAPVHNGGILQVEFAGDGCRLLTGSSDRTARCVWLPLSKQQGAGTTFVGHNGPVSSICWSHDGEHILTASADRTARLWGCSCPSPLVIFNGLHHPIPASNSTRSISRSSGSSNTGQATGSRTPVDKSSSSKSFYKSCSGSNLLRRVGTSPAAGANVTGFSSSGIASSGLVAPPRQQYLAEVTAARFFYLDKFVLLATGNKLHMCRYKLADAAEDDDIQRFKSTGSYSLVGSYSSSCNSIADVAAANGFLSTLILLACSNRSIELVDAATLQVACTIPDAHSRPIQRLIQPAASPFVSHPREVQELLASAAPDGLVKLWDVRSGSCVRSFNGHKNSSSQIPIGMAFSPCMQFLATGSEDKAAYVYDLRTCTLLHRLRPQTLADVVTDVAFHPCKPQLVAANMTGCLHWYANAC